MIPPLADIEWLPAWRIIPSRFPPTGLFDRVAAPEDLEAIYALESMTNDRLRDEVGNLQLIAPEGRISGSGSSPIMAAFTHLNPDGSRFCDGSYGVFYAAYSLETAIAETRYHRERFLRATRENPIEVDMRVYNVDLRGQLHDIRPQGSVSAEIYHLEDYRTSSSWARKMRDEGSHGVVYRSVRHELGMNAAIFKPKLLSNCRQERHLCYAWDGQDITHIYRKELYSY